jgi:membrane associated rhomboid family serine protease
MDADWIDRLERRMGWLAAPGLPGFLTAMTGGAALLSAAKPELIERLILDPRAILSGEIWRALTFLIVPPPSAGVLWLMLWLLLVYACLDALETAWGDFKLTVFVLTAALASAAAAVATGRVGGNGAVHLSAFLAFARLAPDREILVLFVLPVKLRWVAAAAAAFAGVDLVRGDWGSRAQLLAGLSSYLLFFGAGHWVELRRAWERRGR